MAENYAELLEEIVDEIVRPDLIEKAPSWIRSAEDFLSRELRLDDGEYQITGTTVTDQDYILLPDGFKRPVHFEFDLAVNDSSIRVPNIVSWDKFSDVKQNDRGVGQPRALAYFGKRAYLAPTPGSAITYRLWYYGKPPHLSIDIPTTDLLEKAQDVLKYQALTYSAPYLGEDERINTWNGLVKQAIPSLRREYWNAQADGGILRIRPDVVARDSHF